ncbi:MAG TPA: MraY family glycosyltransferase [Planctomycetota bacterium]|nr:MraY family glycosyltransferase [Planctomycetota bacterium]
MVELASYLFLVSLFLALVLTPLGARGARRWGILDHPGPRKIHLEPVPLSGGWALFGALTLVVWGHLGAAYLLRGVEPPGFLPDLGRKLLGQAPSLSLKILPIWLGAAAIFVLGLLDDLRGVSARARLVVQGLVAAALVALGYGPSLTFFPPWAAGAIGVLWIVGVTNAFNFLDGLDGLAAGVAFVGTLALLTIMGVSDQPNVVLLCAAWAGMLLGFLRYNAHPARVFLGSSGSLLVGYFMAMATLLLTFCAGPAKNPLASVFTPLFVVALPLYDTASVILIRLREKRPLMTGDRSHFHHRLMRIGFSHRQAVAFVCLMAFAVALSAVRLVYATPRGTAIILLQIGALLAVLVLAERVVMRARGREKGQARSGSAASGVFSVADARSEAWRKDR